MATTENQVPKNVERKAAAKEQIVNTTSGAREIVDHAVFNARAVGKMVMKPFNKEAKADAIAKAREDKAASGQKMAAIRQAGAQQAEAMRASARGEEVPGSSPQGKVEEIDGVPTTIVGRSPDAPTDAPTEKVDTPASGDHDKV